MNRLFQFLFGALGFTSKEAKSVIVAPGEFTKDFARVLRKASPGIKVSVVKDLELKITSAEGRELSSFLDNAYDVYREAPTARSEVIERFVGSILETIAPLPDKIDPSRIIPIIKDRPWLEETGQALLDRGSAEVPELVYEDFNTELIILYAVDSSNNIRYLIPDDLETTKIERSELRALACENLKRLLPPIECHGSDGFYMFTAGGTYEASLLVLDSIWTSDQVKVMGDLVCAVPTRDLLFVTGSQNPQGIAKIKEMVQKVYSDGSYRLTQKLFVYRNGQFTEFQEDME